MADPVVAALVVVFAVQFLLWIVVTVDARGAEDPNARWFAAFAISPLVGLVAAVWYLANRRSFREDGRQHGGDGGR